MTKDGRKPKLDYPPPPAWAAKALATVAGLGVLLSLYSTYVHYRVKWSDGAWTSACNLGESLSCDSVVTSSWGMLAGLPVSIWSAVFYAVLLWLAIRAGGSPGEARNRSRADALGLAFAGVVASAHYAGVSYFVLHSLCPVCSALYAVSAAALGISMALASPLASARSALRDRWQTVKTRPALAGIVAATVVAVLVLPSWLGAPTKLTREQVFKADPGFYDWYTAQPIVEPPKGGIASGPETAAITLMEFSDFQCPHCARAHVTLKDILPRFGDDVRFVFFNYPLSKECNDAIPGAGHENACTAAAASICAAEQDRFKPLVDKMFGHQEELEPAKVRGYAEEAGLDLATFDACLKKSETQSRIRADVAAGQSAGIQSTPTFIINGRLVKGNMAFEKWLMALFVELDKK